MFAAGQAGIAAHLNSLHPVCQSQSGAAASVPSDESNSSDAPSSGSSSGSSGGSSSSGGGSGEGGSTPSPPAAPAIGALERGLGELSANITRLFPVWVLLAAFSGYHFPQLYLWFDTTCVTWALVFMMASMGLTLTYAEIGLVFTKKPQLLVLGMLLQYTVLPSIGYLISRFWGLTEGLAVGVALVSCMPGGTASNIVAYIAKGDMPLSIMMTTASTLMAIGTTPILTSLLVGTLVPVDGQAMFMSVLQLVLAPVIVGTTLNQLFPAAVQRVKPFTPFLATVSVFMVVASMIASNVAVVAQSGLHIISAVFVLHSCGFALGFFISKGLGLSDKIARTNSIEVGMQSSALAAVLAKLHFADPVIVAPCVLSACTHTTIGSILAGYWAATSKPEEEEEPKAAVAAA
ncbi:MAG: hypothetical protein WDW38_004580 [Sanguina aurantia]